jgi:hypothetical protein
MLGQVFHVSKGQEHAVRALMSQHHQRNAPLFRWHCLPQREFNPAREGAQFAQKGEKWTGIGSRLGQTCRGRLRTLNSVDIIL